MKRRTRTSRRRNKTSESSSDSSFRLSNLGWWVSEWIQGVFWGYVTVLWCAAFKLCPFVVKTFCQFFEFVSKNFQGMTSWMDVPTLKSSSNPNWKKKLWGARAHLSMEMRVSVISIISTLYYIYPALSRPGAHLLHEKSAQLTLPVLLNCHSTGLTLLFEVFINEMKTKTLGSEYYFS